MKNIACLALALGLWTLPGGMVFASEEVDKRRIDLQQLRDQIDRIDRNLDRKEAAELSLISDLRAVENEERRLTDRIDRLSRSMKETARELDILKDRAGKLEKDVARLESDVKIRLRALYQGYGDEFWQIMFSPVSPAEKAEDLVYFQRIVQHDRTLLSEFREKLAQLRATASRTRDLQARRENQVSELKGHRQTLGKARKLKNRLIARIRRERSRLEKERAEMKAREGKLLALIKRLETEYAREYSQNTGGFSRLRGTLPWPARGEIQVGFGTWRHPELGTLYESQGLEISTGPGQPIKSVGRGKVVFANPLKGYGKLVIVDHGDSYYSLYARADRLSRKVGDIVESGETVAIAGSDEKSLIYFEIRNHGKPLDPTAWLKPR